MKEVFADCLQSKNENVRLLQSLGYLFSHFSQAGIVPRKDHKFSAYGLKLAQFFLKTLFLLSRTGKTSNSHLKNLVNYRKKKYYC